VVFADDIALVRRTGEEPPENILKKTGKWKLEGDYTENSDTFMMETRDGC
jgi:hypothetical protein